MSFKFNYEYQLCISYEENVNPRSKSKIDDKLTEKLKNFIAACRENLEHAQEL